MADRFCVLTGDLVRSSRLARDQLEALMAALEAGAETARHWTSPKSPPLERFRGDGWQLVLNDPRLALRTALFLRASLRQVAAGADSRIGFGIGSGRLARTLAASGGVAFELSGTRLEQLKGPERWALQADDMSSKVLALSQGLILACERWSRGWTCKQAEVVAWLIQPDEPVMATVAEKLRVKPQTVQSHFAKAGGRALLRVVNLFEDAGP